MSQSTDILHQGGYVLDLFLESLDKVGALYAQVPSNIALAGHCLYVASLVPDWNDSYLLHYWATFLAGFGGGSVSAMLLDMPLPLLADNTMGIMWSICWWAVNYFPFGIVRRIVTFVPIMAFLKFCVTLKKVELMAARVDLTLSKFPTMMAPIIVGTIAMCGGKFCFQLVRHGYSLQLEPAEITRPTFTFKSSVFGTLAYYGAVHVFKLMSRQQAVALLISVLGFEGLVNDLTAIHVDFTAPFFFLFHLLTFVPHQPKMVSDYQLPANSPPAKQDAQNDTTPNSKAMQQAQENVRSHRPDFDENEILDDLQDAPTPSKKRANRRRKKAQD